MTIQYSTPQIVSKMLFTATKITSFIATVVVACIAADGVFFSALNCTGTKLQTVIYTDGLCVPSNGAESTLLTSEAGVAETVVTLYTDLDHQDRFIALQMGNEPDLCVNIPGNIRSVGMVW
ncbi:hypothetical protein MVEN_00160600 [Mycena venus]|uniref:Uncharacterized protein n=1 Tax=Mycena venus TaxID=2733690 RepID=A0A8H6YWI0_9AGAR|nr:hypothetical protein MVEN_00160600 [Mycena venus]